MSYARTTNGYDRLSGPALLAKAYFIHSQVSTRTSVFATPVPTMAVFKDSCDEYQSAWNAAQTGDKVLIGQKNILEEALLNNLHQLGSYVQMVANGDPQIVLEAGFEVVKPAENIDLGTPGAPEASYTGQPGELLLKLKPVKGARAYLFQYTADPEMKSWTTVTRSRAKGKLTGLTPGTLYHIRVGVVGAREQERFGPVITMTAY